MVSFMYHGIALAKYMAKQGGVIFFPSKKNSEWTYFIDS